MKTSLLCLALLVASVGSAVATEHPERQVTFMLDDGAVELPMMTFSAPLESIQVYVPDLDAALNENGVVMLGRVFPDFSREDTTAVAWSGESVRLTDFSQFWYTDDAEQPLPSGVYFVAMRAGQSTITRKVVIIR